MNRVLAEMLPVKKVRDSRVSRLFHPRSFRRYQTLGGIDARVRDGKGVFYGLRHFVKALLVRKLLWERMPADPIVSLVARRDTEETRRLFLEGMEFSARTTASRGEEVRPAKHGSSETWIRHPLAPGMEIQSSLKFKAPSDPTWS